MSKNTIIEFGDFQTPEDLCLRICRLLAAKGFAPAAVLEPTCGIGGFLAAASEIWPNAQLTGADINPEYVAEAKGRLKGKATVFQSDFFNADWDRILAGLPRSLLVIGNLPWVTNAAVGSLKGSNLPQKSNFQGHKGFDAITGKGNFDISEWMLIKMLGWLAEKNISFAMLCKTAVARKALAHGWKHSLKLRSSIYLIDAKREFDVSVDACLLVVESASEETFDCPIYATLEAEQPQRMLGYREKHLVADLASYQHCQSLVGISPFKWRSGIKHDCSRVMEFNQDENGRLENGFGETVELEPRYLYPMLKSSCLANGRIVKPRKKMLVPQQSVKESTEPIANHAPKTWEYLLRHKEFLDQRGSSIYKNRSPFSIFGVGSYSFTPWKVAISGFYHSLDFRIVGTDNGKPIVVDDTINFIPCQSREGAEFFFKILNSPPAKVFFNAFVFWDAKRPLTAEILQKLNLVALAEHLGESVPKAEKFSLKQAAQQDLILV